MAKEPKKKSKAKAIPQKKKRVAAKRAKPKTIAEQIDAFDWRDVKKIRVGEGMVARENIKPPKR